MKLIERGLVLHTVHNRSVFNHFSAPSSFNTTLAVVISEKYLDFLVTRHILGRGIVLDEFYQSDLSTVALQLFSPVLPNRGHHD